MFPPPGIVPPINVPEGASVRDTRRFQQVWSIPRMRDLPADEVSDSGGDRVGCWRREKACRTVFGREHHGKPPAQAVGRKPRGDRTLSMSIPSLPAARIAFITLFWAGIVSGQNVPAGYTVPAITLSQDQRYGVTVPSTDSAVENPQNEIIEIKTGRVVGAIRAEVAFDRINNGDIVPAGWTADDSMLLWQVDGKWGFETEILVKLAAGEIKWQVDILQRLQQEMLKRTRQAVPKKYAAVKAASSGYGSWYKDGFAIDCVLDNPVAPMKLPLLYHCFLTSNTKGLDGVTNVDARMTAQVNVDGTVKVEDFHMGTDPPARNW